MLSFLERVFDATIARHGDAPPLVTIGDSILMVSRLGERERFPAFLYVYVDDCDAVYRRAIDAGAVSLEAVWDTPYGDRRGMVKDAWGNVWQIATQIARR